MTLQAENDPSLYGLFVVYDSGAQEPISDKQCPLMVRLRLGPSEGISKIYIMEKSDARAAQISAEVCLQGYMYMYMYIFIHLYICIIFVTVHCIGINISQ